MFQLPNGPPRQSDPPIRGSIPARSKTLSAIARRRGSNRSARSSPDSSDGCLSAEELSINGCIRSTSDRCLMPVDCIMVRRSKYSGHFYQPIGSDCLRCCKISARPPARSGGCDQVGRYVGGLARNCSQPASERCSFSLIRGEIAAAPAAITAEPIGIPQMTATPIMIACTVSLRLRCDSKSRSLLTQSKPFANAAWAFASAIFVQKITFPAAHRHGDGVDLTRTWEGRLPV